jgi:hypothetical protein
LLGTAVMLVALTFCIGGMFGMLFALVWNWLMSDPAPKWALDMRRRPARPERRARRTAIT